MAYKVGREVPKGGAASSPKDDLGRSLLGGPAVHSLKTMCEKAWFS